MSATPPRPDDRDHDEIRLDAAGYVLGGLTPAEQQAFEAHLATCPACRAEVAELDPLPVLLDLARTSTEGAGRHEEPQPTHERALGPARRRGRLLVGATVVIAVLAGVALGVVATRSAPLRFSTPVALQAVAPPGGASTAASGTAAWRATDSGTVVRLDLSGLAGGGGYYECLWISGAGVQSAGTFRADGDGRARVDLTTAATRYPGWRLEIRAHPPGASTPDGTTILEAGA